ncbi:MAG: HlyD family efflux transporter periplasmic adaptor subunit [Verrucomicrobiota bacterium]
MDIPRPHEARRRRRRRIIYGTASLLALALVTVGLSQLKPAAPSVEGGALYPGTVKRGEMLREVRGNGALLPEEIRWIPAMNAGRVELLHVQAGAAVQSDTIILELSNPELVQAAFDAEWAVKAAEAQSDKLKVQLDSDALAAEANVAALKADCSVAKLDAEADEKLLQDKLVDRLTAARSRTKAEQLAIRCALEDKRLLTVAESRRAQLAAQEAELARLRAVYELKKQQVESLKVRAGIDGVLQKLGELTQLQVGQQIAAGANLARVANPKRLKAEIKVAETQAKDIELNQVASIDTRNGLIPGHVTRIDPAAINGTVTVDVALDGPLPKGARPDLTVDGTIQLEKLEDVVFVGRPVHGEADSTVSLFKVIDSGKTAIRVPVKLGRTSVSFVEIREGLQPGDQIILSDMSQWDGYDRLRLN